MTDAPHDPRLDTDPPFGPVLVVIPTYNERESLPGVLTRLHKAQPGVDVLVVDDGSPDGTGEWVEELATTQPWLHLLRRAGKQGLGTAYVAGFTWGLQRGYDVLVEMDADGSHQPEELGLLLQELASDDGLDLVIGARWIPGGRVENWPMRREVLSRGANTFTKAMLGLGVGDATAGFRAYRARILPQLDLPHVSSQGYCFQIDLTRRVRAAGGRIGEVPIVFVERAEGQSKMSRAIIVEAMTNVTMWGLRHRWRQLTGRESWGGLPVKRPAAQAR